MNLFLLLSILLVILLCVFLIFKYYKNSSTNNPEEMLIAKYSNLINFLAKQDGAIVTKSKKHFVQIKSNRGGTKWTMNIRQKNADQDLRLEWIYESEIFGIRKVKWIFKAHEELQTILDKIREEKGAAFSKIFLNE